MTWREENTTHIGLVKKIWERCSSVSPFPPPFYLANILMLPTGLKAVCSCILFWQTSKSSMSHSYVPEHSSVLYTKCITRRRKCLCPTGRARYKGQEVPGNPICSDHSRLRQTIPQNFILAVYLCICLNSFLFSWCMKNLAYFPY